MANGMEVQLSVHIAAPPARVFQALTDREKPQPFFFESVLDSELRPGARLEYVSANGVHLFVHGEVLEVEAPRRFAHTFRFADLDDPPSRLEYTLEPEGTGSRLTLRHHGFDRKNKTYGRAERWGWMLGNLKSVVETGALPWATRAEYLLIRRFVPLMPKRNAVR